MSGSAIFELEAKSIDEISEVKNLELVVIDYFGNESIHPFTILDEWLTNGKHYFIEPKQFTIDKDDKIVFA